MFGKMKYVNKYLKEKVKEKKELFDYVYVNNFIREDEPISIVLKQGEAIKFKKDMKQYISYIKENLAKSFKDDDLSNKKKFAEENLEKKKKKIIEELNLTTKPMGFEVVEGAKGVFMLPVKNGKTLSKEEYEKLDQKEEVELEEEKLEENVIKEEKNYNNYDQKIEEAVEKFESKIKEEKEKDEVGKEI